MSINNYRQRGGRNDSRRDGSPSNNSRQFNNNDVNNRERNSRERDNNRDNLNGRGGRGGIREGATSRSSDDNLNKSINISVQNVYGRCENKCQYLFDYQNTSLVGTNNGIMLSYTCDEQNTSPVDFNQKKYNVKNIVIVAPSIHLFNGSKTDAEILIVHNPVLGGIPLIVGLPISESSSTNSATSNVTDMINAMASNAPSEGETAQINISSLTLNNIIPKKPFFAYMGPDMNRSPASYIMFGTLEAIPITSSTLDSLTDIIQSFDIKTPGKYLFFNRNGPNSTTNTDGIYISCQPTGASEDTVTVDDGSDSSETNYNLGSIFKNKTVQTILKFILMVLIFLALFKGISLAYNYLTKNPIKLTGLPFAKKGEK